VFRTYLDLLPLNLVSFVMENGNFVLEVSWKIIFPWLWEPCVVSSLPCSNILIACQFKGSTVARQASDKEKQKELPTFKDNDFVNDGIMIYIGKESKERLESTLKADVDVSGL